MVSVTAPDAAAPKDIETRVREVAADVDGVLAIEKCRIRKSGTRYFVEIHVEVDGDATVRQGHVLGGKVRGRLRESELRIADALVHVEPHEA